MLVLLEILITGINNNQKRVKSTKNKVPFDLFFVQLCTNRIQARDLEKYLKVSFNKEALIEVMRGWRNW
ncbi:MAG: hypothetical protein US62_C0012G0027 [Candidatus Woesebacteria bacterium GW2011_GWA1_37_8]|uniref:Uncharacterized protein n=2 Tax=Candidatus Woeseibacteriota TaxID=1752722 RepID=A0A0G0PBF1_9BACT|nr:MAG: hypothetical protein US39_C0021G0015 [Microgenomates group bacterium GW2011_GWC1_37_12b]KKQ45613.1 MAG: hypothetical protein US62_C0012G0027 [Candidatus Woesebacteria bacterium GW2011_GWA1_37_8]KKQ86586.1 MAG: hypothetical protein UT10_C0021G0003 [Candidatus Woesebacteria bacterium GW2011_GWB1_38_8b]